jgi:hypothetical protein
LNNRTKEAFLDFFFFPDQTEVFTFKPGAVACLIVAEKNWDLDLADPATRAKVESAAKDKVRELRQ